MVQRIRYFDIAKGLAITCMILGHAILRFGDSVDGGHFLLKLNDFIFSFHMPLFFIISGYFMHPDRGFNFKKESRELL